MLNWSKGRHETGYLKKLLFSSKYLGIDCYIIKYPTGSFIPLHKDPVKNRKHYRINVVLPTKHQGGDFVESDRSTLRFSRKKFYFFRPDLVKHAVSKVKSGTRYVFSIGWTRKL